MIEAIFIAARSGEPQVSVDGVSVIPGKGIVGDRNFDRSDWPGQNITFIEAEAVEDFNRTFNLTISPGDTRRNVVTRGVRLNDLVGRLFEVGGARFYGVELCEPCATLGDELATDTLPASRVVKAWVHKGGLRANVISDGELRCGMRFSVQAMPD